MYTATGLVYEPCTGGIFCIIAVAKEDIIHMTDKTLGWTVRLGGVLAVLLFLWSIQWFLPDSIRPCGTLL